MANLITLGRLVLLVVVVVIAYQPASVFQLINVPLLILVFVMDGLDGYIARKRDETSLFGAMFDIAGDRVVEMTMWIVLADLDLVAIWVPLIFIFRGVIVDTIRSSEASSHRQSPFAMMTGPIGKWLVGGKFMRIFYATLKATAFCWLLIIQPMPVIAPSLWADYGSIMSLIGAVLVYLSVIVCILRGVPVVTQFIYSERNAILGKTGQNKASKT